jgi:long-chain acyl-CoA synthetase
MLIEREKRTNTLLIPTMAQQCLVHPDRKKRDLSSLVGIAMGGMVVNPDLVEKTRADLAPSSLAANSYGASEALGITSNAAPDFQERPDSVGPCFLPNVFEIRDSETGENITHMHEKKHGDIWVKGPQISKGYWKAPDSNKNTFMDVGWRDRGF